MIGMVRARGAYDMAGRYLICADIGWLLLVKALPKSWSNKGPRTVSEGH